MSRTVLEHIVRPLENQSSYEEFTNLNFVLGFAGRKMLPNTVRLNGRLKVLVGNPSAQLKAGDADVFLDPDVASHSVIQTISTSTSNQGNLEALDNYGRYVKIVQNAMTTAPDQHDSRNACELRCGSLSVMRDLLEGEKVKGVAQPNPNTQEPTSFSLEPLFILNSVSSLDGNAPAVRHNTTGDIRVSIRTAPNNTVFFGVGADVNTKYQLSDLFITFNSIPDDGEQGKLLLRPKYSIKQTAQSSLFNFSANAPINATSATVSYITQSDESNINANSFRLERPLEVSRLQYLLNDQSNVLLTYPLEEQETILEEGLSSVAEVRDNQASLSNLYANNSYLQGLRFGDTINLAMNKFGFNLDSQISNSAPMTCFVHFHGLLPL